MIPYKVLVISNKPPYPIIDGGCFAMSRFEQLIRGCFDNVNYFALSTTKHPFKENELPDYWKLNTNFFTEFIDTRVQNKHVLKYFAGSSIRASRFYSKTIEKKILSVIKEKKIELVFFESVYAAVYLPAITKNTRIKTCIRCHNIEHQLWERHFSTMRKGLKRLAYRSETSRLKTFEDTVLGNTDGNIFISDVDLQYYDEQSEKKNSRSNGKAGRRISIPVQMKVQNLHKMIGNPIRLFHIGAMDWAPNIEGIKKFIKDIFPAIIEKYPTIQLHLAGKAMPTAFYDLQSEHIIVHGEVDNAEEFMKKFDILVVPIESGSGIRIKILEAMALGIPVISTVKGIEGIGAKAEIEYMEAQNIESWLKGIHDLSNQENYSKMSNNEMNFIEKNYSEKALYDKLLPFLKQLLNIKGD